MPKHGLTIGLGPPGPKGNSIGYHFIDESNSVSQNVVFAQSSVVESRFAESCCAVGYRASSKLNSANIIRQNGPQSNYSKPKPLFIASFNVYYYDVGLISFLQTSDQNGYVFRANTSNRFGNVQNSPHCSFQYLAKL